MSCRKILTVLFMTIIVSVQSAQRGYQYESKFRNPNRVLQRDKFLPKYRFRDENDRTSRNENPLIAPRLIDSPEKATKNVEYTVYGHDAERPDERTAEAKSKHGCMATMKRSKGKMSQRQMTAACAMYMQWGQSMRKETKWTPTDGQMKWWKSLGETPRTRRPRVEVPNHGNPDDGFRNHRIPRQRNPDHDYLKSDNADHRNPDHGSPDHQIPDPRDPDHRNPGSGIPIRDVPEHSDPERDNPYLVNPDHRAPDRRASDSRNHGRYPRQSGSGRAIRKEYRALTDSERHDVHEAMRILKNSAMDGMSKYDIFVHFHQGSNAPGAHFGPGFFGYHRELLHRPPFQTQNPYEQTRFGPLGLGAPYRQTVRPYWRVMENFKNY